MSDKKLVSPLLDGFVMGDAMSNHDGVCCCPAMKENTDDKYIVKIISVPPSQKQLDALLLTGACKDAAAATEYFKSLADEVVKEAKLLQQLGKLEGFLPYDNWQIVPMDHNDLGYEIYLVGSYKQSLEKYLRRNTMTHLSAVKLGLDLCAALSICRRAGYVHVDLKPSNIFRHGDGEYRIGDLGFVKLSSLKYASLPSKYRSRYTPPELHDEMATLNPTADIYAVGLILYQIYNNGQLPFSQQAPHEPLPAPANADYELAEIILKACHPNPRNRWQTPIELGQELANYMQRNEVSDTPIVPPAADPQPEEPEVADEAEETPAAVSEELSFMEDMVSDETAPGASEEDDQSDAPMSDEVSNILAQAEDLISHELPVPDLESETESEPDINTEESPCEEAENGDSEDDEDEDDEEEEDIEINDGISSDSGSKRSHGWIAAIVIVLLLSLIGGSAYYYYNTYYLLPIDKMNIHVLEDTITVELETDANESLLTVVCTDTYGNTQTQNVSGKKAVFTGLNSDTLYNITVNASGFHKTSQSNSGSCHTAKQTKILDITAKTGTEDGSVILNFTVNGPEIQDWIVEYSTEDEETGSINFTGHTVTVTGLTVGKTYTFTLTPATESELWLVGSNTLDYTASKIVMAENLSITSCTDGVLTAQWNVPEDVSADSWNVRCYSESGYDKTITTTELSAQFDEIDETSAYTVEVTADGMTQSSRAFVSANPTTITDIQVSGSDKLTISWTYSGNTPDGGWLLLYSINGGKTSDVIKCTDANGVIEQSIPKATYQFTIQAADGSTVFGGSGSYTCPQAADFNQYSLSNDEILVSLCKTPSKSGWTYKNVSEYVNTYSVGDKISMVLYTSARFYRPSEDVKISFIIRDADGNVLLDLMSSKTTDWRSIWNDGYAYLDLPTVPDAPGAYTVDLYFNDSFVLTKKFTIN